jgi:hypothetical protein
VASTKGVHTTNPKRAAPVPSSNSGEDAHLNMHQTAIKGRGKQRQLEIHTERQRGSSYRLIHSREEAAANRYPQQIKK